MIDKPPYQVPSMAEIAEIPWNGYTAASTFSGCGGSSLGYRMAGFKVLWASEFVEAARDTYRANAPEYTILDDRDIRQVEPAEVLDVIGLNVGELDLLDGSPPCASFSTAGKRHKHWGEVKAYSDTKQRTDDLFSEYARLVRGIKPRVFVAENVSGLVKGSAKGYFLRILSELRGCGYRVRAKLLDAQWLGVPQARQRLIFIGVREDLDLDPAFPTPLPYRYALREALPWILAQGDNGGFGHGSMRPADVPSPTIGATPATGNGRFPPSRVIHDTSGDRSMGDVTDRPCPTITVGVRGVNSQHYQIHGDAGEPVDPETEQSIAVRRKIRVGEDADDNEAASIEGYAVGQEWRRLAPGESSDKYLNLTRAHPDRPSPTVTAAGVGIGNMGAPGGVASVTHPSEPRKFTIAELRRICGFPDDFVLTGNYQQRWERLGRAVPPVMMSHIAATVRDQILGQLVERKAS